MPRRRRHAPDALLPLKPAWLHILLSLADQDRHGYGIMLDVAGRTGGRVRLWPATLYGSVREMTAAGLTEASSERPPTDDDPRRRYYRLTIFGRKVLAAEAQRLEDLADMVRAKGILAGRGP